MNRTTEYLKHIDGKTQTPYVPESESFYDTINSRIEKIEAQLGRTPSYREILKIEEEFNTLSLESQQTLDMVSVEGTNDLILHFEGVKKIILMKLQGVERRLRALKDSKIGMNIDLEPERPHVFRNVEEVQMMEEENKKLVEGYNIEGYRLTRRRLLEVEALQDTIFQHLVLQDERIDSIVDLTSKAGKYVSGSSKALGRIGDSGRFLRRFLFILLLCLSFVLLFLHYYYK
ncbi:hypothetical protein EHEL_030770 [Encephalitozoon hellem ATCC 50504]|uniref:t-SNARE coiled-coil homology domain-containing protein n=1 Tax=Encephalitozoon hellem TaxID=27973 RepID=A0A9Q9C9I8_ENCHE|nr:uncharacterized protein EHEL_030770 [Encephalitozoon hellem ATCC 50504]AFM97974.1 hypothetical protein EHEL_030770 [Encephalitozoon hellem ATCC 50504]UTX42778.1 hypothetical protein GPU96_03g05000 [Encephalitozoon hellem]WEL38237.1 hypothetical protein PFJ87_03g00950 [Encephalitozoon hellem]|eukprot:XP_003886955.1 hypothetical protein EHEL_030770 [Encephalitozoon hellem ATCC 50504]